MWNILTYLHLDLLDFAPSRSGKSMYVPVSEKDEDLIVYL